MGLSAELISQFAKITKDTKTTKTDTIVYGTAVVSDGVTHVKIDGSDLLTPVGTTIEVNNGERVTVMIKDHKATITGSTTSPSASTATTDKIAQDVVNNKAIITKELQAETARINNLIAENATIKGKIEASEGEIADLKTKNLEVDEKLTAAEAEIERLDADKITAEAVDAKYATIENLDAANAAINNLRATQGNFEQLTTNNLSAVNGSINELKAKDVTIENTLNAHNGVINNLESTYAKITDLEATNAEVDTLDAGVAKIDELIFGSASGDVIQSTFANAVIAQLGDAQIKSAMIQNVDASKINAGTINTNNVNVQSDDGKFLISDETMQISDDTRVRVQIGKDASGDYSINIWDTEGKLMFSKGGITDSAIKEAIIRDDMVAENANISASKLDISSLFSEINGSTETIKSNRIYLDEENQTLDVSFKQMSSDVSGLSDTVSSQGTDISVIQGQISSKIWQQDINAATGEMNTKYSTLEQTVNGISGTVAEHSTEISKKADNTTVTTINNKVADLELDVDGFKTTVSETYATKESVDNIDIGGRNYFRPSRVVDLGCTGLASGEQTLISTGACIGFYISTTAGDMWTLSRDSVLNNNRFDYCFTIDEPVNGTLIYGWNTAYRNELKIEGIVTPEGYNYLFLYLSNQAANDSIDSIKLEKGNKATDWTPAPEDVEADIATVSERVTRTETSIESNAKEISLRATKTEVTTAKNEAISTASSDATNKANAAKDAAISTASSDATQKANAALESANKNTSDLLTNYSTTTEMVSKIESEIKSSADSINLSVKETYATKTSLASTDTKASNAATAAANAQADIDNLEIGARNYFVRKNINDLAWGSASDEYPHGKILQNDNYRGFSFQVVEGETWTLYRTDTTNNRWGVYWLAEEPALEIGAIGTSFRQDDQAANVVNDLIVPTGATWGFIYLSNDISTGDIPNIMLEKGNKPTDWSPAPEDTEASIAGAYSEIGILKDSIISTVKDENGKVTSLTQTGSGWEFQLGPLDGLPDKVDDLDTTVNGLKEKTDHINATTVDEILDDGSINPLPALVLFESDLEPGETGFKSVFTNKYLNFVYSVKKEDGTTDETIPTRVTTTGMETDDMTIDKDLNHVGFQWKKRANGNYGLSWIGGDE